MTRTSSSNTSAGFTLLEVIIAVSIMVITFASILAVESNAINASARAKKMNIVQMLAKQKMIETETRFERKTFDEFKKEDGGKFAEPYDDFTWATKVATIDFPNISSSIAAATSGGDGAQQNPTGSTDIANLVSQLVSKYLSEAVREVTVTISWKRGTGEQHYSISTYWVDLNHDFPQPGT